MVDAKPTAPRFAIWDLGFRPFFLFGCAWGCAALLLWLGALAGHAPLQHLDVFWHAHEMIHGFVAAIVVGFLLTASQNWSGTRGVHGRELAGIVGVWAAGRIACLFPESNEILIAAVDLAFLPLAAACLARYLLRAGQRHNLIYLFLLALLWSSNLFYHLDRHGVLAGAGRDAVIFGVHTTIAIIVVVASRVLPFFSERAVPGYRRKSARVLDGCCVAAAFAYALLATSVFDSHATTVVAIIASVTTLTRLVLWFHPGVFRISILWVLYVAYAWIPVGFLLSALAGLGFIAPTVAVHAFTAGAIGTMIVGMVSRVSLGHTGRPIVASTSTVIAYVLVTIGSMTRIFGPLIIPSRTADMILWAGVVWAMALLMLVSNYGSKLVLPRVDGRPA